MSEEFHRLEESLKKYLSEDKKGGGDSVNANFYKYNNLKIYMEPLKNKTPHLIIRIGISEAMYDLGSYEKISGGLGEDEKNVRAWLERYLSLFDLGTTWKQESKPIRSILKNDLDI